MPRPPASPSRLWRRTLVDVLGAAEGEDAGGVTSAVLLALGYANPNQIVGLAQSHNSTIIESVNATHGLDKVKVFRALGDETRLAMVRNLRDAGGEMPCSSLVQACRTTRTAASYHYKELEQAGLITRRREGQSVTVVLNVKVLAREFAALLRCL